MKNWSKPEIKELNVSDTEGYSFSGTYEDGFWTSKDGKMVKLTYSSDSQVLG